MAVALSVVLAAAVFEAAGGPASSEAGVIPGGHVPGGATTTSGQIPESARWPQRGQAAVVVGKGSLSASREQRPVPIASVAKVMTAYLTLKRYPLKGDENGFTITVTAADVEAETAAAAAGQSVVKVETGERLTERQLLEALLIPSGNNIAWMLAAHVAGSVTSFIDKMNEEARSLGMNHTTYTDPSGFAPSTVSTAADQLRVLRQAMRSAVFRQIASMPRATLPVAGTLTNYNPLIAAGYGGKTGSDRAAGGCLAFFTDVSVAGHTVTVAGVVLGQGQGGDTSQVLGAAGRAAVQLVRSVAPGALSDKPRLSDSLASRP